MAHEVHSRPLPPAANAAATRPEAAPSFMDRVDRALEGLWHFLTSMRLALVLILVLAVLGVVGSLVVQAPPGVLTDAEAKAGWLNEVRPRFGPWTDAMNALQVFEIFNSVLFRVLVAALTISLIACSVHRIPGMWRTATAPRLDVGASFFEHAPQHEAIVARQAPAEALALVRDALGGRRYRTLVAEDEAIHVYADRFRWAPFAGLVGHLSLVVILAGAIVGATFGYRDAGFTLAEGARLPIAAEPGLEIELVDFTDTYYIETGAPSDYASEVILYKDGQEIDRHTIRVNDPLRYGNTALYQAFFGSAAVMTVQDAEGNVLVSEGVPLAWRTTADNRPIGSFSIPGTPYVGWVIGTLGSGDTTVLPGQMQVDLYTATSGQRAETAVIDQGKPTAIGDLTVTFERESQFTGLNVARDPGVALVWIGSILLFAGFVIRFTVHHRRLWIRITPRGRGGSVIAAAGLGTKDVVANTEFDKLVNDIRAAVQPSTQA
jgi:cytochrome c biogenesis protein